MSRKITVINKTHPFNQMKAAGEKARKACRKMSNEELDAFLRGNIADRETRYQVLALTRARKIDYVINCTRQEFVRAHNEAAAQAKAEKDAANA